MYNINCCPSCLSKDITYKESKLARFVVWRATQEFEEGDIDTHGLICNHCGFIGSQLRMTEEEEFNLYKNYRSEEYNQMRIICEPSYKDRMYSFKDKSYINSRRLGIQTLIDNNITVASIGTVLDFGGDTGIYIPKCFSKADRYVFDISGVKPLPGIQKYDRNKNVGPIDFLMCCHVLEHMSNPDHIFYSIKELIDHKSWIYFEVPNYRESSLPPVFHEHINIFNKNSFTVLLMRNGFKIIDVHETNNLCVLTKLK